MSDETTDTETTDTEAAAEAPAPAPAASAPATAAADADEAGRANRRKVREGIATSTKMDKTVVVTVVDRVRHPRYGKTVQRSTKLHAHDEANDVREGDRVRIAETRPLSKLKRWRVVEVLERAR
jgi:small subunit ribosomal protein S17